MVQWSCRRRRRLVRADEHRIEVLEVNGLGYIHPDSGRGVRDINLRVPRGSFTVITGQIGSGKTTLLRNMIFANLLHGNGVTVIDPLRHRLVRLPVEHAGGIDTDLVRNVALCKLQQQPSLSDMIPDRRGQSGAGRSFNSCVGSATAGASSSGSTTHDR